MPKVKSVCMGLAAVECIADIDQVGLPDIVNPRRE